jgi:hypothetical protein
MFVVTNHSGQLVEFRWLDPAESEEDLQVHARQFTHVFSWLRDDHYEGRLGLHWVDPDPPPSLGSEEHLAWRRGRLRESGLQFLSAVLWGENNRPLDDDNAIVGAFIGYRPEGECGDGVHQPYRIVEWSVQPWFRGIGGFLLQEGLRGGGVHSEDEVVLDVSADSPAIAIYRHLGFVQSGPLFRHEEPVYDDSRMPMAASGAVLLPKLAADR